MSGRGYPPHLMFSKLKIMVTANINPIQDYTREYYNSIPAWSNSRLGQVKRALLGYCDEAKKSNALTFGIAFHESILEADKFKPETYALTPGQINMIRGMQNAVFAVPDLANAIKIGQHEKIYLWRDPVTKQPCKLRLDTDLQSDTVLDFKTTSASSQKEFMDHFIKFEYDRQAAMYLKGTKAKSFLLVGVQKRVRNPQIFLYEINSRSHIAQRGAKKFRFIINKAVLHGHSYIIKDYV